MTRQGSSQVGQSGSGIINTRDWTARNDKEGRILSGQGGRTPVKSTYKIAGGLGAGFRPQGPPLRGACRGVIKREG